VHTVETCCNEKDGAVDILTSGKLNTVLVFIGLAKEEGYPQ